MGEFPEKKKLRGQREREREREREWRLVEQIHVQSDNRKRTASRTVTNYNNNSVAATNAARAGAFAPPLSVDVISRRYYFSESAEQSGAGI